MNYLMNGLAALAFIVLFSQCAGKTDNQTTNAPAQANAELSGMKIAYVEIDTLLAKYNFCIDLNEAMVKKSENVLYNLREQMVKPLIHTAATRKVYLDIWRNIKNLPS